MSENTDIFHYDPNFSFTIDGNEFHARDPLPAEEATIEVEAMRRVQFPPLESIRSDTYQYLIACATCNLLITKIPDAPELQWLTKTPDWFSARDGEQVLRVHGALIEALGEHRQGLKKNRRSETRKRASKKRREHSQPVSAEVPDLSAERIE